MARALAGTYLENHRHEVAVTDLDMAAFMCVKTVETLTHTAVLHRGDLITGTALNIFVDEVTRLVTGYLKAN